jgi:hypothetical protein
MWSSIKSSLLRPIFGVALAILVGYLFVAPNQEVKVADEHLDNVIYNQSEISIEGDKFISWFLTATRKEVLPDKFTLNRDFNYTLSEVRAMVKQWPSQYPDFNSFNDPNIRDQIRSNVLKICNKILELAEKKRNVEDRVEEIKAIQNLYANEEVWQKRQIPKYYHATKNRDSFLEIMNATHIKFVHDREINPAAWFGTGFYKTEYIFSFSSDLELPVEDIAPTSHYMLGTRCNYFGLGRTSDIVFYNSSTTLVSWAVPAESSLTGPNFIRKRLRDKKLAEFYAPRGQTNVQMILERHMISLAQIYSTDRANGLLMGALHIEFNFTAVDKMANVQVGEVLFCTVYRYTIFAHLSKRRLAVLGVLPGIRKFAKYRTDPGKCSRTHMYIPDIAMDAMQFVQVLADGQLLSDHPKEYLKFNFTTVEYLKEEKSLAANAKVASDS